MDKGIESLGDGLFRYRESGEIFCMKKLKGTHITRGKVTFFYENYKIEVTWTEENGLRSFLGWKRIYG